CCALTLSTFWEPAAALPLSSTSIQRPPRWVPVFGGIHTMCFPFFTEPDVCEVEAGLRSKFNSVGAPSLVLVLLIEALTVPFTINVTRYVPAGKASEM